MKYIKAIKTIVLISSLFLLNACTENEISPNEKGYYYSGIYFGHNLNLFFEKGIKDGCTTSKGRYKKSHFFFKNNKNYYDGWFMGRYKCKDLLLRN